MRACKTSKTQVSDLEGNNLSADAIARQNSYHDKAKGSTANQIKADIKKRCHYCGTTHRKLCPAYGQRCSKCRKMNHFARVCLSSTNRVEAVLDNTESGMNLDELFIDFMNVDVINHQNELLSTINVNGADITFKVDTVVWPNYLLTGN